ncbi:MAG: isoleucine--tRNA ligase [Defluviitaleaceae bacterium]|nr:isoleucine--tRNA ligase [Defluviitaleaceae bacterium]
MYKKVDTTLNFADREQATLEFWQDNKIFEKSVEMGQDKPPFAFYDGPPTANGRPHIGHIHTRALKDLIPRYKTMKGYNVLRKAGWDTHGLPVELEVEKELGIYGKGKHEIEKYGIEEFIKHCKSSVWRYEQEWKEVSQRVGLWLDMEQPYITYENGYIESVWWALRQIWDKGLIYKGHKILPYCPRCGTGLSTHEVDQGYKEINEDSIFVQFKVKNAPNTYLLAWTTTPWTLPSNVAVVVHPTEQYAKVEQNGNVYILAEALVEKVMGQDCKVVETVKGKDLEYTEYEALFDFVTFEKKAFYVTCDDYVSLSDGTGIVHTAPAFGEDDNRIAKSYGLPFVQLVNEQGCFLDSVAPWAGVFVKKADPDIIKYLQGQNNIYRILNLDHRYPHCWRCDSPLLYYARNAWFIEMTKLRDQLVANNNTVNWYPENIGEGRFGNFLEGVKDWGLSRERYWGTPLPVWECSCGHMHMIGSVAELEELSGQTFKELELHKPHIDKVTFSCKCGKQMQRIPEVIDCWFDSGSMPFAQFHYPFKNKEIFEQNFPANFISEAIDQTRGWFYSLMAISTAVFGKTAFKNVIVMGHTLDKDGKKMSKSKGNAIDPHDILKSHGADSIRWYFFASSAPWLGSRFYLDILSEYQRKFMGTFWNTYAFYILYANIDKFDPTQYELEPDKLPIMDKWILSKLHSTISAVDVNMEGYKVYESTRILIDFVNELSNWYVRRCRERFWAKEMPQDKINAYMTLYTVLKELTLLCAPFIPFMTEEIYQNLVRTIDKTASESVHLCSFPVVCNSFVDKDLEQQMGKVYNIVELGRSARNAAAIKNRQPLQTMYVQLQDSLEDNFVKIIKEELNIKEIEFIEETDRFTAYKYKPNLPKLGPKHGSILPKIGAYLATAPATLATELKTGTTITVDGKEIPLTEEDVLVEITHSPGYITESNKEITVVLAINLTEKLVEEGFVREIISKTQNMRKDAGFEVTDKIRLYHFGNEEITKIMNNNADEIKAEVLATEIIHGEGGAAKQWDINGEVVTLGVDRV